MWTKINCALLCTLPWGLGGGCSHLTKYAKIKPKKTIWVNIFQNGGIFSGNFNLTYATMCNGCIYHRNRCIKRCRKRWPVKRLLQSYSLNSTSNFWGDTLCVYERKMSKHQENHLLSEQQRVQTVHPTVKSHPHPHEPARLRLLSAISLPNI